MSTSSWAQVPSSRTLLTPSQCIWAWTSYIIEANDDINQAYMDLKKNKPSSILFVLSILKETTYVPLKAVDWVFMNLP
ncbi:hypothetical protein L6164_003033 [Bauhinia variegata]|uniref:Uncharacterized protein n=1 Tax=Bauhinia variegata TaxID=167791 RepID=A0ACB9Q5K0_BAUVA|nr:hypothetical protein L6164_003033 [Bauhinia variegata]